MENTENTNINITDLNNVAGGSNDGMIVLKTVEEIENSPIFDELKAWIRKKKRAGYPYTGSGEALYYYAYKLGYILGNIRPAIDFCEKYWKKV
jgi:hypothetical protein